MRLASLTEKQNESCFMWSLSSRMMLMSWAISGFYRSTTKSKQSSLLLLFLEILKIVAFTSKTIFGPFLKVTVNWCEFDTKKMFT